MRMHIMFVVCVFFPYAHRVCGFIRKVLRCAWGVQMPHLLSEMQRAPDLDVDDLLIA